MTRHSAWKRIVTVACVIGLATVAYAWWNGGAKRDAAARYATASIAYGDLTQTVAANGTLNPVALVNVGTQVSGTVRKLYADFNDKVKAGQMLLELDPALFEAQLHQSEANLQAARAGLDLARANETRGRAVAERNFISRQDLEQLVQARRAAEAQVALAEAQVAKDRTNLGYTVIRSPVSGVVVDRSIDIGQTVAASFQTPTLFKIARDLRRMQIDSSYAEADIGQIRVGQPARFTVDAFPGRQFTATVRQLRLNPTTQQNVVTYDVVLGVDNPEQILLPGMTAYVNIVVAQHDNVLLVPNAALRFRPQDRNAKQQGTQQAPRTGRRGPAAPTVYVLRGEQAVAVTLTTGITDNNVTEVLGGDLKPGDQVITADLSAASTNDQSGGNFRVRPF